MELTLHRQDLVQVSATCRKTMRLLPMGKKKQQQKVVVGDDTGALLCFGMKKDQLEQVFKTAPTQKEVSRITLGGDKDEPDNIFWASGSTVRAMTKKGKEYLRFNTNVTEIIRSLHVDEEEIHTGGDFIYNLFVQCKDAAFYMATDRINDLTCERVTGGLRAEAVLACQDRSVRVISGSELLFEQTMQGPVLSLERYHNPPPPAGGASASAVGSGFGQIEARPAAYEANDGSLKEVVYGTENGVVGLLMLDEKMMRRGWIIDPTLEGRRSKGGGVVSVHSHD